jgi:hypothetical protein
VRDPIAETKSFLEMKNARIPTNATRAKYVLIAIVLDHIAETTSFLELKSAKTIRIVARTKYAANVSVSLQ